METTTRSNCAHDVPRAERIARLNDELRKNGNGGQILITKGVQALVGFDAEQLARELAAFDEFDPFNDPHGERDFGSLDLFGGELLFKVDYYAPDLLFGSNDPADPTVTQRVLTVLLAEEY
ncbi:MAG TPA: DUF3768 domain-containing protein [Sphingomicrobium sp.]|nr:DUF3768 domain-containing protein [Sphingomicrobium sp.]